MTRLIVTTATILVDWTSTKFAPSSETSVSTYNAEVLHLTDITPLSTVQLHHTEVLYLRNINVSFCEFVTSLLAGYTVSSRVLSAMATRYGGKNNRLAFNDFVLAASKLSLHIGKLGLMVYSRTHVRKYIRHK